MYVFAFFWLPGVCVFVLAALFASVCVCDSNKAFVRWVVCVGVCLCVVLTNKPSNVKDFVSSFGPTCTSSRPIMKHITCSNDMIIM